MQTGLEKNLFGNHPVSLPVAESRSPPPAFASDPLISLTSAENRENGSNMTEAYSIPTGAGTSKFPVSDISEIEDLSSAGNFLKSSSPAGVRAFLS